MIVSQTRTNLKRIRNFKEFYRNEYIYSFTYLGIIPKSSKFTSVPRIVYVLPIVYVHQLRFKVLKDMRHCLVNIDTNHDIVGLYYNITK